MSYIPLSQFIPPETLATLIPPPPTPSNPLTTLHHQRFTSPTSASSLGHVEFVFDLGNWSPDPAFSAPSSTKKYASMLQILQYPFSRGSIHITPDKRLSIDPGYYAGVNGDLDLEITLHAQRFAEKICATQPLAGILRGQVSPSPEESGSDEALREWIRRVMVTDWHPVGTCAMIGGGMERGGVVDERLRVYGVKGLRVVDASVMPLQISAHLQATVYAIGEKGAAMVLEDWGVGGLAKGCE